MRLKQNKDIMNTKFKIYQEKKNFQLASNNNGKGYPDKTKFMAESDLRYRVFVGRPIGPNLNLN
jgi:hypothetical protein